MLQTKEVIISVNGKEIEVEVFIEVEEVSHPTGSTVIELLAAGWNGDVAEEDLSELNRQVDQIVEKMFYKIA